jgi:phospholipid/cholesterol/gamma-HCH transport system permease protein
MTANAGYRVLQPVVGLLAGLGRFSLLLWMAFRSASDMRMIYGSLLRQMVQVGVASLPIAGLAIGFSGAVTTVQAIYQLENPLLPPSIVGSFVVPSLVLELGALVTAFVLTARVGARIAAELGTMRVSEQIDALEVMGINSVCYLVAPRVMAGVLMFPAIYILVTFIGVITSALVAHATGEVTIGVFFEGARLFFKPYDVFFGLIKSLVFGFIITSIACYKGYYTAGGAEGVGKSTTEAAVLAVVFILVADYLAAVLLL